jgi:hypothetical protein
VPNRGSDIERLTIFHPVAQLLSVRIPWEYGSYSSPCRRGNTGHVQFVVEGPSTPVHAAFDLPWFSVFDAPVPES